MRFLRAHPAVGVLVVGTSVLTIGLVGCGPDTAGRRGAGHPIVATPAPTRDLDPAHVASGPARAEIGRRYPFDLFVHCGGEYAFFGGYAWHTDTPPGGSGPTQLSADVFADTEYLPGWMTQTGPNTAVFDSGGRTVVYDRVRTGLGCD